LFETKEKKKLVTKVKRRGSRGGKGKESILQKKGIQPSKLGVLGCSGDLRSKGGVLRKKRTMR